MQPIFWLNDHSIKLMLALSIHNPTQKKSKYKELPFEINKETLPKHFLYINWMDKLDFDISTFNSSLPEGPQGLTVKVSFANEFIQGKDFTLL